MKSAKEKLLQEKYRYLYESGTIDLPSWKRYYDELWAIRNPHGTGDMTISSKTFDNSTYAYEKWREDDRAKGRGTVESTSVEVQRLGG